MNNIDTNNTKSILILDDDEDTLEQLSYILRQEINAKIVTTLLASQAEIIATENFFDFILIDVTLNYSGSSFGGIELYKKLLPRYGRSSLIIYSQFVKDDFLKQESNLRFNFISKGHNLLIFKDKILNKINALREQQTCFIAMPFDKKFDECFEIIKHCVQRLSYTPVRIDKQFFSKPILSKMWEEILYSKLVFFFSVEHNPNVFYECGYAVAMNKEVLTITDFFKNLPFDVRERNAIEYQNDLSLLEKQILYKLSNITSEINF